MPSPPSPSRFSEGRFWIATLGRDSGVWVGIGLVGFSLLAFLWILIPPTREGLYFSPEPAVLLESYLGLSDSEAKEHLARFMAGWVEDNQPRIDPLFTGLRWGTLALGVGIVILLAKLGGLV